MAWWECLLLGIGVGWVTLPCLVALLVTLPGMMDRWLHPKADPFWKPKKR